MNEIKDPAILLPLTVAKALLKNEGHNRQMHKSSRGG